MRVFSRRTLVDFWTLHADSESALRAWFSEVRKAKWKSPVDVKQRYPNARILAGNRIIFNIKGNSYRLIVKVNYDYGQVFIRFIGTHADYDNIDATKI